MRAASNAFKRGQEGIEIKELDHGTRQSARSRLARWSRLVVFGALVAYALILCAAHALYPRLLYPAPQADPFLPGGGTLLTLRAEDGALVHALQFAAAPGAPVVVYFHGNGVVMGDDLWMARELSRRELGVVLCEYRGYGLSAGLKPGEAGLYADAEAVLAALAAQGIGPARVVLFGESLGTGVAAEMAARGRGSALVLVTPYTSIPDVAQHFVHSLLPARLLMRERFDTLAKAPRITVPTLVLHGSDDAIVPYALGTEVASALPHARLITIPGGHHNDLFLGDGARLFAEIVELARRAGGLRAAE